MKFEILSGRVIDGALKTVKLAANLPQSLHTLFSTLSHPDNRAKALRLLWIPVICILIALICKPFLRRSISGLAGRMRTVPSKIAFGLARILLIVAPYGLLLVLLFLLFRIFPTFPKGRSLIFILFSVWFFYRLTVEGFRALLSPDDGNIRILPFSDENAQYGWIWALRFTIYTAFYSALIRILWVSGIPSPVLSFIRGILLVIFPIMITVFLMQMAREIRIRLDPSQKNGEQKDNETNKMRLWVMRYWAIPAVAYAWAIFIFLLFHFQKGFNYLFMATLGTIITILALSLALLLINWIFKRFFTLNEKVSARFPGLEEKTNRYILITKKVIRIIFVVISLGVIAQIWGIPISGVIASKTGTTIILRALAILITIGVVVSIIETSQFTREYLLKRKKVTQKQKTLVPMISTAVKITAGFIGGIVILDRLGVNTTPILAGAGIVGLAVGFGSQTLVKDLINGLFILFEESVRVGDYAVLGKDGGIVESVGLRTVRLRDVEGNVHVIPNSTIDALTNMSKDFSRSVLDVGVAYRENVDEVIKIIEEIGEGMRNDPQIGKDILEPIEIFGLQQFDDSAVVIRARLTTKPLKQWGLKREFNRRVKNIFDERGIEIPFPHRTIYMGEPKEGTAAPMHVKLQNQES
jgi:small conductance mechanosensitive channel